jgi:hypothetical protein
MRASIPLWLLIYQVEAKRSDEFCLSPDCYNFLLEKNLIINFNYLK